MRSATERVMGGLSAIQLRHLVVLAALVAGIAFGAFTETAGGLPLLVDGTYWAPTEAPTSKAAPLPAKGLSRGEHREAGNDVSDLANAAVQMLASPVRDAASACNRAVLWEELGLSYRARQIARRCPSPLRAKMRFASDTWGGRRQSSFELPAEELRSVNAAIAKGDEAMARRLVRHKAAAWRGYFEGRALEDWAMAPEGPARRSHEDQLRATSRLYLDATGNPSTSALVEDLASVQPSEVARTRSLVEGWLKGSRLAAEYEASAAIVKLREIRPDAEILLPGLVPSIDLALTACKYHAGDIPGLLEQARQLREHYSADKYPFIVGRSYFLEAVAHNAQADWEGALRAADEADRILSAIGEDAYAAYLGTYRSIAHLAFGEEAASLQEAALTVKRLAAAGDTRFLAFAESSFGWRFGGSRYQDLAIEMQREAILHNRADGNPGVVTESLTVLGRLLGERGDYAGALTTIRLARQAAQALRGAESRRRMLALQDLIEAEVELSFDPHRAISLASDFLGRFASFGDRYGLSEALLVRAKAHLAIGSSEEAEADLLSALDAVAANSGLVSDPLRSARVLDRAREALETFFSASAPVSAARSTNASFQIARKLRTTQRELMLSASSRHPESPPPRLGDGACQTDFFSTEEAIYASTSCGDAPATIRSVAAPRREVLAHANAFRLAAQEGQLEQVRTTSTAVSNLLRPLLPDLNTAQTWQVVPDAYLSDIPYAWLSLDGRFLFETVAVSVLGLDDSRNTARLPRGPWLALAVGPSAAGGLTPLAAAQAEARLVAEDLGGTSLVGANASLSNLRRQVQGRNLLHFAGHVGGASGPWPAWIQLSPDPEHPNGRVTLGEIAGLDLSGLRLAVLAACSSGNVSNGRLAGALGFSSALLRAGAESVVATLWDVEDLRQKETSLRLYRVLKESGEPEQSLHRLWTEALDPDMPPPSRAHVMSLQLFTGPPTKEE